MLKKFIKASAFASKKHKDQRRKDAQASPYINHPIALCEILSNEGEIVDVDVLCAAMLHDTVEDTETTEQELEEAFGSKITSIVMEVTDDKSLPKAERKQKQIEHAPHISAEAKLVKLADKIANVRDVLHNPPANWPEELRKAYFLWAAQVVAGLKGINPKLEAIFSNLLKEAGFVMPSIRYFVTFDGLPFTCGGDFESHVMAWDEPEPRPYSMPPDGLLIDKAGFESVRRDILGERYASAAMVYPE